MAQYDYNKDVGKDVGYDLGKKWIDSYKAKNPNAPLLNYFIGSNLIQSIIDQGECVGIKMCNALKEDGSQVLVLVGIRKDGTVIWSGDGNKGGDPGIVGDDGIKCPPYCSDEP